MDCRSLVRQLSTAWQHKLREQPVYASLFAQGYSLEACLTMKQPMEQLYDTLSNVEKITLKTIVSHFGVRPFRAAELAQLSNEQLIGLVRLRQKAIVYALKMSWEEPKYILPIDSAALWHPIVLASQQEVHDGRVDEEVFAESVLDSMLNNLFRVVLQCSITKLEKTKQQTWNKRQQANMEQTISIDGPFGPDDDCALDYILQCAKVLQLIYIDETGVIPLPHRIHAWLEQDLSEQHRQLYRHIRDQAVERSDLFMMHVIYWCEARHGWFCAQDFERWVDEYHLWPAGDRLHAQQFADWVNQLYRFGWLERTTGKDGHYYRFLLNDQAWLKTAEIIVKPDFELYMTPAVPLGVRWVMEMFAERQQEDTLITYVLTKEKVTFAVNNGITLEEWVTNISPYVKHGIPENILQTLAEWEQGEPLYRIDVKYPEIPDLYPGLHEIPSMWLNEMRSYHPSTSKAIFEKALLWRAYVKCKAKESEFRFLPERMKQAQNRGTGQWVVVGKSDCGEPRQLNMSERIKLQLVLPGVNEKDSLN